MIKVLVVSDNESLVEHMKYEAEKENIKSIANFDYKYSCLNLGHQGLVALGCSSIDMKNPDIICAIKEKYDLVFSLHCKQIFPAELVTAVRCINFHPGLNPYNRGWYPQVFSIINKKPLGVTIHLMDAEVDHGEIIYQEEVDVFQSDTSLEAYNRVLDKEKELISLYLENLLKGHFESHAPIEVGNYNSIEDFVRLCQLDLESYGTLREHLDLLRALSHGGFNNGYFYEGKDKVFLKLNLVKEICGFKENGQPSYGYPLKNNNS